MKKEQIKKLKKELKSDGKKQFDKLRQIAENKDENAQQKAVAKATAYVIEMRQNIAPVRYPAAAVHRAGEKPQPFWMPHDAFLEKMRITKDDLLYGVAFEEDMCLYKPKVNPYNDADGSQIEDGVGEREDPVERSWPSLVNAKYISELCVNGVREAESVAALAIREPPVIYDADIGRFKETSSQNCIKSIYQVGRILYLDYVDGSTMEGNPECDRMLFCHDGKVEDLYRVDGILYRTFVYDYAEPAVVLSDPDIGVPEPVKVMTYEELKKANEPYRIAQWYSNFRRFEVMSETEWIDLMMQVKKDIDM